ncbi:ulp1 protease family, C-terminal catalytic domain-containing protein, partial [Tanacetum coccineum]
DFFKKAEEKLSLICAERVMLEEYMRKARLENPGDGKFIGLHEKYFNLFKDSISFKDDENGNNVGDDDNGNGDDGDDDANYGDGNVDENDENECDKNPNGSNQSFTFNKISLDDFGNDSGPTESEPVDPTKQGTVVDVNTAEEGENTVENYGIMSSPEEFTQWLNKNVNLVGEACDSIVTEYLHGDLFGDNSAAREALNEVDFFKKAEEKLSLICAERVMLEEYMRKARLENPGDGKFIGLHEKYFNLFKDPISFEDDGNGNNVGDDDDGNGDDGDDDANDGDGNVDENDANECDKNPNGSNQSFGFNKISLDDFGNDSGPTESEPVDPTKQGTVVDVNTAEEGENTVENYGIMSSPEEFTQWLNKNVNLVGEACDSIVAEYLHGDLFGDNSAAREALNEVVTPQIQPIQKRVVKPSSYVLSPYMNKKTNVVPKITKMEFIVGNSLFAMQGDKLENVFEAHFEKFVLYGIRLNLETLSPGLWLDANVIDCWGAILNYEERFRAADSKSRHFFPTGCITESMLDGTFTSFDEKWKRFSDQVNAQFNDNEGGRGLEGVFFPICNSQHFYVVVFSLTKTTTMTILDNSPGTYDSKYKDVCDLLKKLFSRHLKLYGHPRHATVARVKHTIPKVKWKTKENFYDCGIFTMLHMENFNGRPAFDFDCGLPVESQLQLDILRRLRFKFATKILLHEINLQSEKMVEFAKEFDKKGPSEKISIIIDAIKNREERDRIDN